MPRVLTTDAWREVLVEEKKSGEVAASARSGAKRTKLALTVAVAVGVGAVALVGVASDAKAQSAGPGECASELCGRPPYDGGGCGSGCSGGLVPHL